jgi:RNA polymerase sigma-70 factor (ECF subfamily)
MTSADSSPGTPRSDYFATTRWTVVVQAGQRSSPQSARALTELCETYWYPLYCYVRRRVGSREDAEDLVQGYFERFVEQNDLEHLSADRGRFRAFLLASMKHFMANQRDRAGRQKRGGGHAILSLDWQDADTRFQLEPADPSANPELEFDRHWAMALLERVVHRLRDECTADGKADLFEQTKGYLTFNASAIPHAEAAAALGWSEGAVRVAVHRLRQRYRTLLREEIAQTLVDPAQVADELRSLLAALTR